MNIKNIARAIAVTAAVATSATIQLQSATPEVPSVAMTQPGSPKTVEIASFREVISPEVGANICGYDADQASVTKHDDLWAREMLTTEGFG